MRMVPSSRLHLGVAQKLGLIAGILICALLVFSAPIIEQKWDRVGDMKRMESLTTVTTAIGALAHEMQKERGMSAGFLGSSGQKLGNELRGQREETNKRLADLNQLIAAAGGRASDSRFDAALADAMKPLGALNDKRKAIDGLSIDGATAVDFYTQTIGGLLDVAYKLPLLTADVRATQLALAYVNLLYLKENTGIERAVLTNTFAADKFLDGMYAKLLTRIAAQNVYAHSMLLTASEDQLAMYQRTMQGPAVEEVARLRKAALEKFETGGWNVEPGKWFAAATQKIDLLKQVEDGYAGALNEFARKAREEAVRAIALWLVLSLSLSIFAIVVVTIVCRNIVRSLRSAVHVAEAIAHGDLTKEIRVTSQDETGALMKALQAMQRYLVATVATIKVASETVRTASHELAQGNADLSHRTEEQASSLEETAASMEELTSTVKQNAENARQASQVATSALAMAAKGGEVVAEVVGSMSSITQSSKKIADIIGVIDGIAFQTNILALNAAVEAARAGEQGRGFAVVAGEVRTLAHRSAAAAKEIRALISDSAASVDNESQLVDEAGQAMDEIVGSIRRLTEIMSNIAGASQEQTSGIEQVNQAIVHMDQVTQQNAALVEEAAAAAESMQQQAQSLSQAVAIFKLRAPEPASAAVHTSEDNQGRPAVSREAGAAAHGPAAHASNRHQSTTQAEGARDVYVEHRRPDRERSVARLPTPRAKAATQPRPAKVSNSDADWQEF